jgi:hypothetical protein
MENERDHAANYESMSPDELRKRADEGDEGAREFTKKRDREDHRGSD